MSLSFKLDRRFAIACLVAVCAAPPAVLRAQTAGTAAADPAPQGFSEVRYEFGSNSLDKTPPFDVPFFLIGDAGERARRVEATFECWKPKDKKKADEKGAQYKGKGFPTEKSGPFFWQPRIVTETTLDFKILIAQPLEAERDCELTLTLLARPSDNTVKAFRTTAATMLSTDLWGSFPGPDENLTADRSKVIRAKLLALLTGLAKPNQLRADGTVFDPAAEAQAFNRAAAPVLAAQDNITAFRTGRDGGSGIIGLQLEFLGLVQTAVQNDVLKKWNGLLRASTDDLVKAFVKSHETGLSLIGMLDVRELAAGRLPTQPVVTTPDVAADASQLQPYESNYIELAARIQTLVSALESARIAPMLTNGLSASERAALVALAAGPPGPLGEWQDLRRRARTLAERMQLTRSDFADRTAGIEQMLALVEIDAVTKVQAVISTESFSFSTVRTNYISMDAGLLYGFRLNEVLPYLGANFYLRPVNKDAPLSRYGSKGRRFALTAGVTLKSVRSEGVRDDAFFKGALVVGAGLRVSPSIRLSGGILFFRQFDENPVKADTDGRPGVVGFAGLSLDFNIAKALLGESGLK